MPWGMRSAVVVTARDVHHDREAATQLALSEQQWRLAFEHSPIGGALLDRTGGVLVVHEALCRMTGHTDQELIRTDVGELVIHQGGQPWQQWWAALLVSGAGEAETTHRRAPVHRTRGATGTTSTAASPFAVEEVIRPAAVLSETHTRLIWAGLEADDVRRCATTPSAMPASPWTSVRGPA